MTVNKKYLEEDERKIILQLKNDGHSLYEISRRTQRSRTVISKFLKDPEGYIRNILDRERTISLRKPTQAQLKEFNRVPVEQRAVIKFLVRKGVGSRFIHEDLCKVYGRTAPLLPATFYWAKQYEQGRTTILNEPRSKLAVTPGAAKMKIAPRNASKIKRLPTHLFKFKFSGMRRLLQEMNNHPRDIN